MLHVLPWPLGASREPVPEGDGDVVFLDGSVRLPEGALGRLAACARREPAVATVSAFSSHGRLARYAIHGLDADALDAHFAAVNAGEALDLPIAEPGCVLVTREALAAVGPFDCLETFCAAASAAGLRHLLAADVYVGVPGEPHRDDAALQPSQRAAIADFDERAPARPLRRRVGLSRLRESPRPHLLLVTHNWGGGVERHVEDIARLAAPECEVLRLRPDGDGVVQLQWMNPGEEFTAWTEASRWADMVALLRGVGIDRLHLHHVHGLPREVLDLPGALGVPYDVTLHDYFPACPGYHLTASGECAEVAADPWGLGPDMWRSTFDAWLRGAARIIAPSHDVASRMAAFFPGLPVQVWPHPEAPITVPPLVKVLLVGGISAIKGARLLEACVADAARRDLPLHFHVAGYVDRPMATFPHMPLTIGGSYAEGTLGRVLALERPDVLLFLSQVPETYSYTLTAALATGKPIVATALGAFAERLRGRAGATLVPPDAAPAAINDALLQAAA